MLKINLILVVFGSIILAESARLTENEKQELLQDSEELERRIKETKDAIRNNQDQLLNLRHGNMVENTVNNNKELLPDNKMDMINYAKNITRNAPENIRINFSELAKYIRREFRKKYNSQAWHCIVGKNLGYDLQNNENNRIFTSTRHIDILLFHMND